MKEIGIYNAANNNKENVLAKSDPLRTKQANKSSLASCNYHEILVSQNQLKNK
jgi:hypothetical protein